MKLIFRIARTELATLFYSPIAWLILVVFACHVGFDFMTILHEIVKIKALGNTINFSVTAGALLGMNGLYEVIQTTIYLYIPLLTMNLMSREYASGSIKLLYSSPVTSTHIILGKYLSMVAYSLLLALILFLPIVTLMLVVPNIDITLAFSGVLGLTLLLLTYCSIGLFMSTITSYQVVAAVSTLSIFAFLNFVGDIGQKSEFVREITYWLAIKGRASEMVSGLICSDDVIYFVAVIGLFITFSIIKIHNEKNRYSLPKKIGQYVSALLVVVVIGYISSRPSMMSFYDSTRINQRTLSVGSQEVMNQLKGDLKITTYLNIFDSDYSIGAPENVKDDERLFKMYTRFKPEIKMKYVYYYNRPSDTTLLKAYPGKTIDEIAQAVAVKKGLNPRRLKTLEELDARDDLAAEDYGFVRIIERGSGEKSFLRIFDDMFRHPEESEISAALKKLVVDPVKIGFIVGHGERDSKKKGDKDYSIFASKRTFRSSLINQGFDLVNLNLETIEEVPQTINILFIAEMRSAMSAKEEGVLERFMARGGNLMIMTDINRQEVVNPLLAKFGIQAQDGIIVQPSDIYLYDLSLSKGTEEGQDLIGGIYRSLNRYGVVSMPGAVSLIQTEEKGYNVVPLLRTDSTSTWIERQTTDFINETAALNPDTGERLGSFVTSYALTKKVGEKEQRIIILGDADCLSNSELMLANRIGFNSLNFNLIPTNFRWLCYGEFPVSPSRGRNTDTDITITPKDLPTIKTIYVFGIPLVFLVIGVVIWLKRRRG